MERVFWFGGLLLVPGFSMLIQNKFLLGRWVSRVMWASIPWVICGLWLAYQASNVEHQGMQNLSYSAAYMVFGSVMVGAIILAVTRKHKSENANT